MHTIILDLILRRIRVKAEEINQLLKNIYDKETTTEDRKGR